MSSPGSERGRATAGYGQIKRYLAVGLANTAATFLLYQLLLVVTDYRIAYSLSFLAGIFFSYLGHARFTFAVGLHIVRAISYGMCYLLTYWLGLQLLVFGVEMLGIGEMIAPLLVLVVVVPVNFVITRVILTVAVKRA